MVPYSIWVLLVLYILRNGFTAIKYLLGRHLMEPFICTHLGMLYNNSMQLLSQQVPSTLYNLSSDSLAKSCCLQILFI